MKIQVGVIGPADSVDRIMYVAKEFEEIEFTAFVYEELTDIDGFLTKNSHAVDQWLFSGVLNYSYAIEKQLITEKNATFPPLHGSSFFGTLLKAQQVEDTVFKKIGIDTIETEEIDKILSYYDLQSITYHNSPFAGYEKVDQLVTFHQELYEQGKIDVVITSIRSTCNALRKKGIPVFRLMPSYLSIKFSLQVLFERAQANRYKKTQMAVLGCKVNYNADHEDDLYYSFSMQHNELELRRSLLYLTEKMNGSLLHLGDGLFFIFTTRGDIDECTEEDLYQLIDDMKIQFNISVEISIGFGDSVLQAEEHVRYGFRNRKKENQNSILIVDEDQSISLRNKQEKIDYKTVELGSDWEAHVKSCDVSPAVFSKLVSYSRQYNRNEFTSQDVARWLQSTERNGRRIVTSLERGDLIEQCGEAQSGERGRPRKVYRFTHKK